ncbi:Lcl C-terminal domain-containing protein [Nitrospina gracilis]|uniref:Lcl C-terminal domain-containing protein n=1 Tax=Nitrospina gracilis TaxID=35801 RepID=UPI001F45AEED|nr:DUF1566 domain-containing protein [Nitrospina gracilis]MCF8720087.1 hypothetical protein [Nitrospina gracilis Nb-211]
MSDKQRFIDNGNGTIKDTLHDLLWAKEDSWQAEQKWLTWDEALEYCKKLTTNKFAGYDEWRLPEVEECKSLMEPDPVNRDKYDHEIHLNPVFPAGPLPYMWTKDGIGQDGYLVDLRNGETRLLYKSKSGRMATRPVRGKPFSDRKPNP